MISKEEFSKSINNELRIIKHLVTLVPQNAWEYRPSAKQRSTIELVRYLTVMPKTGVKMVLTSDLSLFKPALEYAETLGVNDFAAALDKEGKEINEIISKLTEDELNGTTDPFKTGHPVRKGYMLLDFVLKLLAAYKMQLFLYIKANGREDIGTMDVWQGVSAQKKQ